VALHLLVTVNDTCVSICRCGVNSHIPITPAGSTGRCNTL
jgi:hypothetical protein